MGKITKKVKSFCKEHPNAPAEIGTCAVVFMGTCIAYRIGVMRSIIAVQNALLEGYSEKVKNLIEEEK